MSNPNPPKRKVVVTTTPSKEKESPSTSRSTRSYKPVSDKPQPHQLIFSRKNYYWMLAGIGLIALGMVLMAGGHMPGPDVWDDSIIYSWRRTVLAPIFILAGLGVEIYAIFKR